MQDFKNIIFDFGGVLIDIDYHRLVHAFQHLGFDDFAKFFSQRKQTEIFDDLETGKISAKEFHRRLKKYSKRDFSDESIDNAWNSMLIGLPPENIELLKRLKRKYRIFLLSNTNSIHEKAFTELIVKSFGGNILPDLFERIYYSHRIGMRKPDAEIFNHVIEENHLRREETLFIDDSPQHVEGAKKAGIPSLLLEKGKKITEIFREGEIAFL